MKFTAAAPTFGVLLRLYRRRLGLTQEAFAELAGFSVDYIKKLEGGSRQPSAASLDVLAHALELEPGEAEQFRAAMISARLQDSTEVPSPGAGATAPAVVVTEERRLVTAVFCHIVGFTWLPETLDAEDICDIQEAYLAAVKLQTERYGGVLERCGGDVMLALFGVPLAHEDDPERAVVCALGLSQAVGSAFEEATRRLGQPLTELPSVRAGIDTGEVVSGLRTAWGWRDLGVSGAAINTAAKLLALAEPGEVLVGQETAHLTGRRIHYGGHRKPTANGESATSPPTRVFLAIGLNESIQERWQEPLEGRPLAPFIGRERELAILGDLWAMARAGEGQLVSIVGQPGVGKSRLIAEFVSRAADNDNHGVIQSRCISYGQDISLWLIADFLRSLISVGADDSLGIIRRNLDTAILELLSTEDEEARLEARDVLGEVLGLPPAESLVTRAAARIRRRSLVRGLRRIVGALSFGRPTILVLEDIHWIDPASKEVLSEIAVDVPGLRLLVLAAQREGWTAPWSDLGWPERITLRPLRRAEAAAIATAALGNVPLSSELERYLGERAGGNPFFVEELARTLKENDGLREHEGALQMIPDVAQRLPSSLTAVLLARLDRLEPPARALAQVGSVIGRSFPLRLLAHVVEEAESAMEPALTTLQQAEIAFPRAPSPGSPAGEHEYSFRHVTMREAAYNTLVRKQRRELHLKTARAVAKLYPSAEHVETVAYHYSKTDARGEAAPWFEKAGDRAASVYSNSAAGHYYRAALEHVAAVKPSAGGRTIDEAPLRVREKLADVLGIEGRYEEARALFDDAAAGITPADRIWLARVRRKIGNLWCEQRSFPNEALASFHMAEVALGEEPAITELAWWQEWLEIKLARMRQLYFSGDVDELAEQTERARAVIEVCATADQRCRFFENLTLMSLRRDGFIPTEETLSYARRSVEGMTELGDAGQMAAILFTFGFALLWRGALDEAADALNRTLDLAKRTGNSLLQSMCMTYLTVLHRKRGDVEAVREWNARSQRAAQEVNRPEYVAMAAANRAWVALKEDQSSVAEAEARSAMALWNGSSSTFRYPLHWPAVWILIDVGEREDRVGQAIEDAKMLLAPSQAKVPGPIATALHGAIEAWDAEDEAMARASLTEALRLAREMAYL